MEKFTPKSGDKVIVWAGEKGDRQADLNTIFVDDAYEPFSILRVLNCGVRFIGNDNRIRFKSFEDFLNFCKKTDGTPAGKLIK